MLEIKCKTLNPLAKLPVKQFSNDTGFDIYTTETVTIQYGKRAYIGTGLSFELPPGYGLQIKERSGIAGKTGITIHEGTIDNGYTGEVKVIVENAQHDKAFEYLLKKIVLTKYKRSFSVYDDTSITIPAGTRIAQAVLIQVPETEITLIEDIEEKERGNNGFGSTGVE